MNNLISYIHTYLRHVAPDPNHNGLGISINEVIHQLVAGFGVRATQTILEFLQYWATFYGAVLPATMELERTISPIIASQPSPWEVSSWSAYAPLRPSRDIIEADDIDPFWGLDEASNAKCRRSWRLTVPEPLDIDYAARVMMAPRDGLHLAASYGVARQARVEGRDCMIMADRPYAEAFPLDGDGFIDGSGNWVRSKQLPGSIPAFIGKKGFLRGRNILWVHGVLDLIAGYAATSRLRQHDVCVLGATETVGNLPADWKIRYHLHGARVRVVVPHNTEGMLLAEARAKQFAALHASVDIAVLPDGCETLLAAVNNEERHTRFLHDLLMA